MLNLCLSRSECHLSRNTYIKQGQLCQIYVYESQTCHIHKKNKVGNVKFINLKQGQPFQMARHINLKQPWQMNSPINLKQGHLAISNG